MTAAATSAGWTVARVLAWIEQHEANQGQMSLFDLLEIPPTASMTHVRQAFHAVAITRHPDVWRNRLSPSQLDHLVRTYSRVAAAYATLRDPDERTRYLRTTRDSQPGLGRPPRDSSPAIARDSAPAIAVPTGTSRDSVPTIASAARPRPDSRPPAAALGARAQSYFRRAEAAARLGDIATAVLNLRLAIAAEPTSAFLRNALAAAQAELGK